MEQQENSLFDLSIDETSKDHLRKIATWAMVIVATAVVGYVVAIIKALSTRSQVIQSEGFGVSVRTGQSIGGVIFGIIVGLLINYFLFQFANLTKKGINGMSQPDLNSGFNYLKIYFAIIGIIFIVVFAIVFLVVLVAGFSR